MDVFLDHLEVWMASPPERGAPMSHEQIQVALGLLTSCNYGAAVLLSRLRAAGVNLHRDDDKDMDGWTVEQVRLGNFAKAAGDGHNVVTRKER
ncbi:hypothetical protein ACIQC9_06790 [Brevundimonas sp. NPDC092305]|uniref:hypothetical protein n=1 Tax=Brevundimonas sp. NPDC092305 TaxID=3363957 RepID=UPI0037FE59C2